jgi:TfoX/Sxy family transcriptional regulator of competence genes
MPGQGGARYDPRVWTATAELPMASDPGFIEFVCEQVRGAGRIAHRRMFGEYALYCDGKVVALVCDNQLFLKPTRAGGALLGRVREAPPYPGARMYFLIDTQLDDAESLAAVVRATAAELPEPRVPETRSKATKNTRKKAAKKTPPARGR